MRSLSPATPPSEITLTLAAYFFVEIFAKNTKYLLRFVLGVILCMLPIQVYGLYRYMRVLPKLLVGALLL